MSTSAELEWLDRLGLLSPSCVLMVSQLSGDAVTRLREGNFEEEAVSALGQVGPVLMGRAAALAVIGLGASGALIITDEPVDPDQLVKLTPGKAALAVFLEDEVYVTFADGGEVIFDGEIFLAEAEDMPPNLWALFAPVLGRIGGEAGVDGDEGRDVALVYSLFETYLGMNIRERDVNLQRTRIFRPRPRSET